MRKLAAISLLFILLFNVIGYRAWFYYAEKKSDRQLEAQLDKDQYNEADLVVLKVPLNMPYLQDESQFERVDGEIALNGRMYKYVKRKISEGSLILLCIPDAHKMSLKKAKTGFGFPSSPVQKKISLSEFEEARTAPSYNALSFTTSDKGNRINNRLPDVPIPFPGRPPQLSA